MSGVAPRPVRYCTICGAPAGRSATFCPSCGRALDVPSASSGIAHCRECGGELALGDAYCPTCGSPQLPSAKPPARAPQPPPAPATPVEKSWVPGEPAEVAPRYAEPSPGLQVVWFLFVGLWLSLLVTIGAWLVNVTVVGQPAARWLAHRIPTVLTLRSPREVPRLATRTAGLPAVARGRPLQYAPGTRAVYFVAVGWWLSLVWLLLAYALAVLVIPTPVAEWMYDRLATVTTLELE